LSRYWATLWIAAWTNAEDFMGVVRGPLAWNWRDVLLLHFPGLALHLSLEFLALTVLHTESRNIYGMFDKKTPRRHVECIFDRLRFDLGLQLTRQQCLAHEFFLEFLPEKLPCVVLNNNSVSTAVDSI
jgi:hypothetical protein